MIGPKGDPGEDTPASHTDVENNTAIGLDSMGSVTSGTSNTAVGQRALFSNTEGSINTALGRNSLSNNLTGDGNVAVGEEALGGGGTTPTGSYDNNVAVGASALTTNVSGSFNIAVGSYAFEKNVSGNNNVSIGTYSGTTNTSGQSLTLLGYSTDVGSDGLENAVALGAEAVVDASNKIQLGNTSILSVNTAGALTTGAVTYPNFDGIAGQMLTTDGAGLALWSTPEPGPRVLDANGNTVGSFEVTDSGYFVYLKASGEPAVIRVEVSLGDSETQTLQLKGNIVKYTGDNCTGDRYTGGSTFFRTFGLDVNGNLLQSAGESSRTIVGIRSQSYGGNCTAINPTSQSLTAAVVAAGSIQDWGIVTPLRLSW